MEEKDDDIPQLTNKSRKAEKETRKILKVEERKSQVNSILENIVFQKED